MPTQINPLIVTRAGGVLPGSVSDTDVYLAENDGNQVVYVHNPTGSPVTITLVPQATIAGLSVSGPEITVGAGDSVWVGPLPPAVFNDSVDEAHISDPSGALQFQALRF